MKAIFLIILALSSLLFGSPITELKISPSRLRELTTALGIPGDADLVAETQKRWLRKGGQERWEMQELSQEQRDFVLKWAKENGLLDAIRPACMLYDKALIQGGTTGRMQKRLDYLKELWDAGVRFAEVVWLTGDRTLDPRVDGMTDLVSTESAAARLIWEKTALPVKVLFIASPKKPNGTRPNAIDTLHDWLKVEPEPCKALFVSSQPFCGYQYAIVESTLPEAFHFDVVGPAADSHPAAAAILLDSLARWLYQENLTRRAF